VLSRSSLSNAGCRRYKPFDWSFRQNSSSDEAFKDWIIKLARVYRAEWMEKVAFSCLEESPAVVPFRIVQIFQAGFLWMNCKHFALKSPQRVFVLLIFIPTYAWNLLFIWPDLLWIVAWRAALSLASSNGLRLFSLYPTPSLAIRDTVSIYHPSWTSLPRSNCLFFSSINCYSMRSWHNDFLDFSGSFLLLPICFERNSPVKRIDKAISFSEWLSSISLESHSDPKRLESLAFSSSVFWSIAILNSVTFIDESRFQR
jgi:hypothetical protein